MASDKKTEKLLYKGSKSNQMILAGFENLCVDQRMMVIKLSEMELELNEHKIVIDTLKNVDPKRKCYRMIGGILCERVVEDVIPSLLSTKEQLTKLTETLRSQLEKKGTEMNEYKEQHNIRIQGEDELQQPEEEAKEPKRSAIVVDPLDLE